MNISNDKCKYIKYIVNYGYIINFLENNLSIFTKRNIFDDKTITKKWLEKIIFHMLNQ